MNQDQALRIAVYQMQRTLGMITIAELHERVWEVMQALAQAQDAPGPGTVTLRARALTLAELGA